MHDGSKSEYRPIKDVTSANEAMCSVCCLFLYLSVKKITQNVAVVDFAKFVGFEKNRLRFETDLCT